MDGRPGLKPYLIKDSTVVTVVLINSVALFLDAFPEFPAHTLVFWIDYACLIYFIVEATLKIGQPGGFRAYWGDVWNRGDFLIVAFSLPLLVSPFLPGQLEHAALLTLLRLGRMLRFARLMRLVPDAAKIWSGVLRALRASVYIFLMLAVLNLVLAMGANLLFGSLPEAADYFGDPVKSLYSLFKVFTIEGWYEIPDQLASRGITPGYIVLLRMYFTVAVIAGGLLGLSIANAVFVDSMVADNTAEVERMVTELRAELQQFREEMAEGRDA